MVQVCKISTTLVAVTMGLQASVSPLSEVKKHMRNIEAKKHDAKFRDLFMVFYNICEKVQTPCQKFVTNAFKIPQDRYEYTGCSLHQLNELFSSFEQDYNATLPVNERFVTSDKNFVSSDVFRKLQGDQACQHDDARLIDLNILLANIVERRAWPNISTVMQDPEKRKDANPGNARGVPLSVATLHLRVDCQNYRAGDYEEEMNSCMHWLRGGNTTTEGMGRTDFTQPDGGNVPVEIDGIAHTFHQVSKDQFDMPYVQVCSASDYEHWARICLAEYVIGHEFDEVFWQDDYREWLNEHIEKQTVLSEQNTDFFFTNSNRLQKLLTAKQQFETFLKNKQYESE